MIKLIIFDLDGVLVNTKKIHYKAFNLALKKNKTNYQINFNEHVKKFEGLPTKEKIKILIKEKKDKIIKLEIKKDSQLIYVLKNNKLIKSEIVKRTIKLENSTIIFNTYISLVRNVNNKNGKIKILKI